MHSLLHAFLTQPPYRGKVMRIWLTRPSLHMPTAPPSDICSYAGTTLSRRWDSGYRVLCVWFFFIWGPSPHFGTTLETTFSPLSFVKSFKKNPFSRSRERLSGILWQTEKKQKKNRKNRKKTSVKHIRIRLIGGCIDQSIKHIYTHILQASHMWHKLERLFTFAVGNDNEFSFSNT